MKAQLSRDYRVGEFMSKNVAVIGERSGTREAIEAMVSREFGSLVVLEGETPVGLITERDLLSGIASDMNPEKMRVGDLMDGTITRATKSMTSHEAARLMTDSKGRLVVFEAGELVGIVTVTDILKVIWRIGEAFEIGAVISKKLFETEGITPIREAVSLMDEHRIGSVVITDSGEPKGIFTERDLLNKVLYPRLGFQEPVIKAASVPLVSAALGINGREAVHAMVARHVKRLPLTLDGGIVGIVTARDVVEAYGYPTGTKKTDLEAQMSVRYGEVCPICLTRIDDHGLCGCDTIGGD